MRQRGTIADGRYYLRFRKVGREPVLSNLGMCFILVPLILTCDTVHPHPPPHLLVESFPNRWEFGCTVVTSSVLELWCFNAQETSSNIDSQKPLALAHPPPRGVAFQARQQRHIINDNFDPGSRGHHRARGMRPRHPYRMRQVFTTALHR